MSVCARTDLQVFTVVNLRNNRRKKKRCRGLGFLKIGYGLFFFNCTAQTPLHHGAETGLWGREGRKGVEISTETERQAIGACYGGWGGRLVELLGKGRATGRGSVKSGCRLYENAILISAIKNCISDQYDSSLHQAQPDPSCRFYSLVSPVFLLTLPVFLHRSLRVAAFTARFFGGCCKGRMG